ncbi:RloB family protein [Nocardiopsis sp. NPDC007018]|uniref:RloB family protein n=1 Tax=Nocardiopsis sp. NPDC007018 TaxID=3155721 RepID=UPI0033F7EB31
MLVLGEGETEREYFTGLRRHFKELAAGSPPGSAHVPEPVSVEIAARTAADLIVKEALDRRSEGYSEIWAVFDTEGENVNPLRARVRDTKCSNAEATVRTAVSHPAFEVWLLFHHLGPGDLSGCHQPKDAERLLRKTVPRWAKGQVRRGKAGTEFIDFRSGLDRARTRAASTRADRYDGYPWSDVHEVVRAIESRYRQATE